MREQLSPMSVLTAWIQNYNCIFLRHPALLHNPFAVRQKKKKVQSLFLVSLVCLRHSFTYGKAFRVSCWTGIVLLCSSCQWKQRYLSQVSETGSSVWFRDVLFVGLFGRVKEEVLHPWVALLRLQYKADNRLWELTVVELSLCMK